MAYSMVTMYGLNDKLGNVSYYDSKQSEYSFNKPYSEETARMIDQEVRSIIDAAYQRTKSLLIEKRESLEIIAKELLKREVLYQTDLTELIGKRPFAQETSYEAYMNGQKAKNSVQEKSPEPEQTATPAS